MRIAAVLVVCLLAVPTLSSAEPIGLFEWVDDRFFATGSVFNVTNASATDFLDVYIDLYAPANVAPFYSLNLGEIQAGTNAQSIDVLSFLVIPLDLDRATLRLGYLSD